MKAFLNDRGTQRIIAVFVIVNGIFLFAKQWLIENQFDPTVLIGGNCIIFLSSLLTLVLYGRAKKSKTTHGFTKNVYAAFVTKFFILLSAAMMYFYFAKTISIRAVFACMGLYLLYHFVGAFYAARVAKKNSKTTL
jgi:hypothetical protein